MKLAVRLLLTVAVAWVVALMGWGLSLAPDEIEYFRATRWIAEGRVAFVDFWEHHTPLQWLLFAPVARLFGGGPGVGSVIALRLAQIPLWIAMFVVLLRIARRDSSLAKGGDRLAKGDDRLAKGDDRLAKGDDNVGWARWLALLFLLGSSAFVRSAIEYRIDVPGNLGYLAAVAAIVYGRRPTHWILFGALMSAAVLANMRLVPLVVITGALALFWDGEQRRWRFQPVALWMAAGIAGVAAAFVGYCLATGSWQAFMTEVVGYALNDPTKVPIDTFWLSLFLPYWMQDIPGILLLLLAAAGVFLGLREVGRPGAGSFLSLLFLAAIGTIRMLEVQYGYHFQITFLLAVPLAAAALERLERVQWKAIAVFAAGAGLLVNVAVSAVGFGKALQYQDQMMRAVDRLTRPDERVFDGVGLALRREPAYRYWFLPTGLRFMAAQKRVPPYGLAEFTANPPAAVLFDIRVARWFDIFPALGTHITRHYLPLYRELWIPGLTAKIGPAPARLAWTAPREGIYRIWSSELLVGHPWLTQPVRYGSIKAPLAARYLIPLERLPVAAEAELQWTVDGQPLPPGTQQLTLRKGSRVELAASSPRAAGVLVVPEGVTTLCIGPEEEPGQ